MRNYIQSILVGSLLLVALAGPSIAQEKPVPAPTPAATQTAPPAPTPNTLQARLSSPPAPAPAATPAHSDRGEARAIPTLIIHGF